MIVDIYMNAKKIIGV